MNISQILCDMRTFVVWSHLFSKKSSKKWNLSLASSATDINHHTSPDIAKRQRFQTSVVVLVVVVFKIRGHMFWASFLKQSGTWPTDELLWLPKYFPCVKRSQTKKPLCALRTLRTNKFMFILFTNKKYRFYRWNETHAFWNFVGTTQNDLIILIQS